MIVIEENFITDIQCDQLISFFNENRDKISHYSVNSTNTLKVKLIETSLISSIKDNIISHCLSLTNSKVYLDNYEIVEWPKDSYHPPHYDLPTDIFSSLIYLNENFVGGETYFSDSKIIKPKKGTCLTFSNSKYRHSVNKINIGTRYTFSFLFSRINNHMEVWSSG